MHNNSLIKLLRSFSPKEISDFNEFLKSPYFNKKNSVIKLYEHLQKHYPDFSDDALSKKNMYENLFPGKVYNDSNFRVLIHNLHELAKKFIAYRNFENNKFEFDISLLTGLMNKQQFGYLDKMISKLKESLGNADLIADEYNFSRFRIEYENIFFLSVSHIGIFEKFLNEADFEKLFYYLSSFYYIKSMRIYINILNLQIIYNKIFDTDDFEKMITLIDKKLFNDNPVIEIYFCIIKLFGNGNQDKFYFRIKELLFKIRYTLHFDDLSEIYINLTNYCNRKISAGIMSFKKEKFELYKEENEMKLYIMNGFMPVIYFKNFVILALSLNEYEWAKEFISAYKNELPVDSKDNVSLYCLALYEFDMKRFEKASELLSRIKYDELYLKYDSKILQIMIYYETGTDESLIAALEAYRHFLSNNKLLPENKKDIYINFYKFFNKLFIFKSKQNKFELERLKLSITKDLKIFNKDWIIRKIEELI